MNVIHFGLSYPTNSSIVPDPFLRIYLENIHKDKHGSDTGTYDTEGRFIPQRFEDIFAKYSSDGGKSLTLWDVSVMVKGQRCVFDFFGWTAVVLECKFGLGFSGCPGLLRNLVSTLARRRALELTSIGLATYVLLWPADGKMKKDDIRRMYDGSIFYHIDAERRKG